MVDSRAAIEEIRNRLGIIEVVSEYVSIKRAGKSYKGCCPFHSEKTPSFTVSEEFQTWHCFGCGEHGDIFSFLMKAENLTFGEALERLAKRAGVEIERSKNRQTSRKELLASINSLASGYYFELLRRTPAALEYLRSRGLADATIEQFRLGYAAPAWDGLVRYLAKKSVNLKDAEEAGLIINGDRGYYDRYRHRITFPILDIQERIIGFGGRALGDDQVKYLNSPETPLFSKTRSLYGLNLARKKISEVGIAIVVEGYMDVISSHQAGFPNCIGTLGTALTEDHVKVLQRYTSKVVLAYDGDSAGIKAAVRGAAMFNEDECDVRIARLPGGDDPDSILRSGRVADFDRAISGAPAVTDYKLAVIEERHDLSSIDGRTAMLKEAVRVVAHVPASIERERLIRSLARHHPNYESGTTHAEDHIRDDVNALIRRIQSGDKAKSAIPAGAQVKSLTALDKAENAVLKVILTNGPGMQFALESLTPEDFSGETRPKAARILFEKFRDKKGIYLSEILGSVDENVGRYLSALAMQDDGPPVTEQTIRDHVGFIKNKLKKKRTSDVLAAHLRDGKIDPDSWSSGEMSKEYREFLRKTGRLPSLDE